MGIDIGKFPNNHKLTKKWQKYWEEKNIYKFDESLRKPVYSIDTPPPTISGKMHIGHAFSYTQTDFIARYKRMKGMNVFYPFGTDDNGLATEKLIQKLKGVSANKMDRGKYIKLCLKTLKEIKPDFVQGWKDMGLSADFDMTFSSIDEHSRKISQKTFLELYKKGRAYRKESPVLWDIRFQTAIAQAELEGIERNTLMNEIKFKLKEGGEFIIATTRPELLGACVSVMINPKDPRAKKMIGKTAITPIYNHEVPIIADDKVDLGKGTGILMSCTFGDQTDMEWYKEYNLPLKMVINPDGKMNDNSGKYSGLTIIEARKKIIDDLRNDKVLFSQTKQKQIVQVGERSKEPVEIINSTQWYIKYLDQRSDFIKGMNALNWYPKYMSVRLKNWITGLNWDWSIARQRKFGVPIPVWYDEDGKVYLPNESELPVDPIKDKPRRFPKGKKLIPETDVFDTWFTSSSSPKLYQELVKNPSIKKKMNIFDLRPQAHDIINFWLFYTLAKNRLLSNKNPWSIVTISGHVQDPNGRKMSKSVGNVIEPRKIIDKFNVDALRYFSGSKKLGEDAPFQEKELRTGIKLMNKLWNTTRFLKMNSDSTPKKTKLEIEDKWILSKLDSTFKEYEKNFDKYDPKFALHAAEQFFLKEFCDFYLEMIKGRIYGDDNSSKSAALWTANQVLYSSLQLFAPFLCFLTEEIYQTVYKKSKSIHLTKFENLGKKDDASEKLGDLSKQIISEIRKWKQENNIKLGDYVESLKISHPRAGDIQEVSEIICRTARVNELKILTGKFSISP